MKHPDVLHFLRGMRAGFLQLVYPDLCVACGYDLPAGHACFCLPCQLKLAPSDMYKSPENEFTERFWGRLPLETGAALYYFHRRSPIQRALHQLKYHNQPQIGVQLGRIFGHKLRSAPAFRQIDVVVPVPLHPRKERLRGYNQSAMLARGIAEVLETPCRPHALRRAMYTESQTRKKRLDRFQNVETVFELAEPQTLSQRHVLLVDDVLTTGATLEMCGAAILQAPGARLSMVTLAIAMK